MSSLTSKAVTFHNLSAGSTTIMPKGKVIRFGGKIERQDHGTKVGNGLYMTEDSEEIEFLRGLCKMPTPQVWEATELESQPAPAVAATVNEVMQIANENVESAARSTNPAVAAIQAKMGAIIAKDSAAK